MRKYCEEINNDDRRRFRRVMKVRFRVFVKFDTRNSRLEHRIADDGRVKNADREKQDFNSAIILVIETK